MLADPVRTFDVPGQRCLLLRKTNDELRELIGVTKSLYPRLYPGTEGAKWTERDKTWVFPSGATLWMSFLDHEDDILRYVGQAFQWIGFDELTMWPNYKPWNILRSRLRGDKGAGLYMRATTNPGGVGHHWVKKMFIDPAPWGKSFWAQDVETGETLVWPDTSTYAQENCLVGQPMFERRFIPARLTDNPYLTEDGAYEANLLSLPEVERKKLLEGDWDVNEGAAFPEWNRNIHTVEPYEIPQHWIRFRACDYGYRDGSGVVWFAINPNGQLVIYREIAVKGVLADDLGDRIKELEYGEDIRYGVLGSDSWHERGNQNRGPSMGEILHRKCGFRPADRGKGSRIAGKQQLHQRLVVDPYTEQPRLVFFNTCVNTINQIPALPLSKNNVEDVDENSEDHLYDAIRYGLMTRPLEILWADKRPKQRKPVALDRYVGY